MNVKTLPLVFIATLAWACDGEDIMNAVPTGQPDTVAGEDTVNGEETLASADAGADTPTDPWSELEAAAVSAAESGLSLIRKFADFDPGAHGITDAAELDRLTLNHPVRVFYIHQADLALHDLSKDVSDLLRDGHEYWFPVHVDDDVRTSVEVHKLDDGTWEVSAVGKGHVAELHALRVAKSKEHSRDEHEYILVQIPGMYIHFLGHYEGDELHLSVIHDHGHFELEAETTAPAAEVLSGLISHAASFAAQYVIPPATTSPAGQ